MPVRPVLSFVPAPVGRRAAWLLLAALLGVAAGCSSSDSSDASTPPSSEAADTGAGAATIDLFEVPASVDCPAGETSTTIPVSYTVTGAARLRLRVDGLDNDVDDNATATMDLPVHCDSLPHSVVLIAYDDEGAKTALEKVVETKVP